MHSSWSTTRTGKGSSVAAAAACVLGGARILRMHDVTASVATARMLEAVLGLREPTDLRHNVG